MPFRRLMLIALFVCGIILGAGLPHAAQANVACEFLEEGEPLPPECKAEKEEEEAFFARLEREHKEAQEKEKAEEAKLKEEELKREREQRAQEQREQREAREWAIKPKVTQAKAHRLGLGLLHGKVATWTYRSAGSLDCAGGKIDRSHWRCRVSWIAGTVCHGGRLQVVGAGHHNGRAIYESHLQYHSGYGYIKHGRIRCFFSEES